MSWKPVKSSLAFLHGDLHFVLSQIHRNQGNSFEAAWEQRLSHYLGAKDSSGGNAFQLLAMGFRVLRRGDALTGGHAIPAGCLHEVLLDRSAASLEELSEAVLGYGVAFIREGPPNLECAIEIIALESLEALFVRCRRRHAGCDKNVKSNDRREPRPSCRHANHDPPAPVLWATITRAKLSGNKKTHCISGSCRPGSRETTGPQEATGLGVADGI